jgi:hypothetical protein
MDSSPQKKAQALEIATGKLHNRIQRLRENHPLRGGVFHHFEQVNEPLLNLAGVTEAISSYSGLMQPEGAKHFLEKLLAAESGVPTDVSGLNIPFLNIFNYRLVKHIQSELESYDEWLRQHGENAKQAGDSGLVAHTKCTGKHFMCIDDIWKEEFPKGIGPTTRTTFYAHKRNDPLFRDSIKKCPDSRGYDIHPKQLKKMYSSLNRSKN